MGLNQTTHTTLAVRPGAAVELQCGWMRLWGPAVADGSFITSPYSLPVFSNQRSFTENPSVPSSDILSLDVSEGGRVLTWRHSGGRLEILPLFTVQGASAVVQLFMFDAIDSQQHATPANLVYPERAMRSGLALNVAYPLPRDDSGAPQSITMTTPTAAETQPLVITAKGVAVADPATGTLYRLGVRRIFDTAGMSGLFAWVQSISSGQLLLLARVI